MSKEEKSVVVNTMQIADTLKCQHHKIMKRLETYLKRHPEYKTDIILTQYEVGTGRFYKMYDLTQKGLQIYLKMRYEDAGRNSPQTMAGLQQLGKLIKEEEPLIDEASDPGSNVLPKDQGRTQIAGVDELYQLYRDRANHVLIHLMSEYRRRSAKGGRGTHLLTVDRNGAGSWDPYMNMEIAGN